MSRRTFTLPIRTLSTFQSSPSQWVCRRCLATQTQAGSLPSQQGQHLVSEYDPTLPASQRIGPDGKVVPLKRSDWVLKKTLPQRNIPAQMLAHSTSPLLPPTEKEQREKVKKHKKIVGVVIDAGKMDKTVKVRLPGQQWNNHLKRYYRRDTKHLVHDPNNSLVIGDVVELHRLRCSKTVEHVVAAIVSPFGTPIESRPPIPTADDRLSAYKDKRLAKLKRRDLRAQAARGDADAVTALEEVGVDPGSGVKAGKDSIADGDRIAGEKGQMLGEGVLPGGLHAVGKIHERAQHNKAKAEEFQLKAGERLMEAEEKEAELQKKGLATETSETALR